MAVDGPSRQGKGSHGASGGVDPQADAWAGQAQDGDLEAFERLYRRYLPRIYGLCLRMAGDPSLAEELTQDAFARAWEKLHLYRPGRAFFFWLRKVALNVALSERRSRRRRIQPVAQDDGLSSRPDPVDRRPEVSMDLREAMATLPRRARAVFVLHDIEGYRHDEIADLIGIAVGTSKAHLHRARKLLREALRS